MTRPEGVLGKIRGEPITMAQCPFSRWAGTNHRKKDLNRIEKCCSLFSKYNKIAKSEWKTMEEWKKKQIAPKTERKNKRISKLKNGNY